MANRYELSHRLRIAEGDFNGFIFSYNEQTKFVLKKKIVSLQGLKKEVEEMIIYAATKKAINEKSRFYDLINKIDNEISETETLIKKLTI